MPGRLTSLADGGQRLPETARSYFEPRFGYDFSQVRIHASQRDAELASSLYSRAFTLGNDIVFGAGEYDPGSLSGRRLLAHELAHVTQRLPLIARKEVVCNPKIPEGEGAKIRPEVVGGKSYDYQVVGTWKAEDTFKSFNANTYKKWIDLNFIGASRELKEYITSALLAGETIEIGPPAVPGCQYGILLSSQDIALFFKMYYEERRGKAGVKQENAGKGGSQVQPGPQAEQQKEGTEEGKAKNVAVIISDEATKQKAKSYGFPALERAKKTKEKLSDMPYEPVMQDNAVLKDLKLANHYLEVLEHFTGRSIGDQDRRAAADGLSPDELNIIIGVDPMLRMITAMYTQGYREYQAAGGEDVNDFFTLEEAIIEQLVRGNPTAVHNYLKIGHGSPEKDLGIVDRNSGIILYDSHGFPLPSFGGVGFRDEGYIGARQEGWGINIANIEDEGLRLFLNALRQTFSDPTRMAYEAAKKLFENIELVKNEVLNGLTPEIKEKFTEALPYFVGFLVGHGISYVLMRIPNTITVSVGLVLEGMLKAAEYIMDVSFGASALDNLVKAASFLSRVEKNKKNELTKLSVSNIKKAAKYIRDMVADIAILVSTMALGALIRGLKSGKKKAHLECPKCPLVEEVEVKKGEGEAKQGKTPEAQGSKSEAARPPETPAEGPQKGPTEKPPEPSLQEPAKPSRPEAPPVPAPKAEQPKPIKPEEPAPKPEEQAKLAERKAEAAEKRARRAELRNQLRKIYREQAKVRKKIDELNNKNKKLTETVLKETKEVRDLLDLERKAQDPGKKLELRKKAREANERKEAALEELDKLPDTKELVDEAQRLSEEAQRAEIRLNPKHRAALPCFSGDTPIWTAAGPRRIDRIKPGDRVLSYSLEHSRIVECVVAEVLINKTLHYYDVTAGPVLIQATGRHPFLVEEGPKWLEARDLQRGMQLKSMNGTAVMVESIVLREGFEDTTYNLSIDGMHNYFVGPGVLVHNGEGVDIGLGGKIYIYRLTNKKFPGKVYIGQSDDASRVDDHRSLARQKLQDRASLSERDIKFYEFMAGVEDPEILVRGIETRDQASYLEQHNMDIERQLGGKDCLMNRREQIKSETHQKEVTERILKDPKVIAAGYCPK